MLSKRNLAIFILAFLTQPLLANEKIVYGNDDRIDVFEADSFARELAQSTAAQIDNMTMRKEGDLRRVLSFSLKVAYNLCDNERFVEQPTGAACSGFLVGPDLLITAGHCVQDSDDCDGASWVFDYKMENASQAPLYVSEKNIYACKKVLAQKYNPNVTKYPEDYALIRLDRPVVGRTPLKLNLNGKVDSKASLLLIGNPQGLPTKVAYGGKIRKNDNPIFFTVNVDSFVGNSGSAIFNVDTGLVEGILVRGDQDLYKDNELKCNRPRVCLEDNCRGEDVTRISILKNYLATSFK